MRGGREGEGGGGSKGRCRRVVGRGGKVESREKIYHYEIGSARLALIALLPLYSYIIQYQKLQQ